MTSSFVSGTISFEISKFFISGPIWLRGRIPGADSESEMTFYIRGQYWPFLAVLPPKKQQAPLNNKIAIATIQVTDEKTYRFRCSIHRLQWSESFTFLLLTVLTYC